MQRESSPPPNGANVKNESVIAGITVGGQPSPAELASGRFASVVNIRNADEEGNDTGALLEGSDVAYASVPWTIGTVTDADIARIREAVDAADGPVLIH
ncbi:MAG: putative phosphatase [Candidatus Eremiobacteraeota bacterium]|nr:putative phosphatase [Candidatus Eremiobacteraeota bacterium]